MAKKSYANAKGRRANESFLAIPFRVLHAEEYFRLGAWGVKLINDLGAYYNGTNNGDLCATWSVMERRGWNSKATLQAAIKECSEAGFIIKTKQGGRGIGPSLYALSFRPIDECGGKLDVKATTTAPNTWRVKN